MTRTCWIFCSIFLFHLSFILCQQKHLNGSIEGTVCDAETKYPLVGVNVLISGSSIGTVTDTSGRFLLPGVPVGPYSLDFRLLGYKAFTRADVLVRSQRTTNVNAELTPVPIETEQMTVTSGYFGYKDNQALSSTNLSNEEIRRSPGSGGDISRVIMGLPGLAKVNDQSNSLIVRGGSPIENAFYIDNIEIPNINHFPTQGSTGGPIGMINNDLIQDVNFSSGGFSAVYGNKLSSVMEIEIREGNRKNFDGQVDLNYAGVGFIGEGPLPGGRGSWLASIRRSYLDLVIKTFDVGTSATPQYSDYQGKIVYDLHPKHQLTVLGIFGDDHNNPDRNTAEENEMSFYGNQDLYQGAAGITWKALWNTASYSLTTLSCLTNLFDEDFSETNTGAHILRNRSHEQAVMLRQSNYIRTNENHAFEFGLEAKQAFVSYDNTYEAYTNFGGDSIPSMSLTRSFDPVQTGLFCVYHRTLSEAFRFSAGIRADHFSYTDRLSVSPRFSATYNFNELTSCTFSTGIYHQDLPSLLLMQNQESRHLRSPKATQYILSVSRLLTEDTKLTVELYDKEYSHFPVDPSQPKTFLLDELFYRYGFFFDHASLTDDGRATSRGIELLVQKKLAQDVYGLVSLTYFKTRYDNGLSEWRDRVFDNRFIISMEGGYKPNDEWEFSARWIYAGGTPYTPLNIEQTRLLKREVADESKINSARYPDYHSLNIRCDKRFFFEQSNMVVFVSAWNAYNHKNIASYYWNEKKEKIGTLYQWSLLPIFGIEYEF